MSVKSVQFTVAAHIMAALGYKHGEEISSATLAESVNADPTFVRKSLSKLSKAGLVVTKRGKSGASVLAHRDRSRCWTYTVPARHHRRLRFTPILWKRGVRSAATSRSACRSYFLRLRTASRARSRKSPWLIWLVRSGTRRIDFFCF